MAIQFSKLHFDIVPFIEEQFNFKLENTRQLAIIGIVNGFHKNKKKCHISQHELSLLLLCSAKSISRDQKKLNTKGIIKIHKPQNQWHTKKALTMHLHKDIKTWFKEQTADKLSDKMSSYTTSNRGSVEPSFFNKEDSTSPAKSDLSFMEDITNIINNKIK